MADLGTISKKTLPLDDLQYQLFDWGTGGWVGASQVQTSWVRSGIGASEEDPMDGSNSKMTPSFWVKYYITMACIIYFVTQKTFIEEFSCIIYFVNQKTFIEEFSGACM